MMEAAVIGYGESLLNAPAGAVGRMTGGGTESITMALKSARDQARSQGRNGRLNLVLPRSAHPAFDKAAALMEMEVRRTPLKALRADPAALEAASDDETAMIVGSAPCFPYGLIDPIEALSEVAVRRGLWLHVDACVGGYIAPFVRMNGEALEPFDFALPGVSSMSADLHKYGYCAKGASTVFFRSEDLARRLPFTVTDWPGAPMTTPTLAGTRPGGAIAAAYAVMTALGVEGYRVLHRQVTNAREVIQAGVSRRGFEVLGEPKLGLIAFTHPTLDCRRLWAGLRQKGWFTSMTSEPVGLHLMLSPVHEETAEGYLADLDWAVRSTRVESGAGALSAAYGG
jgi:glutamate/tyrosine decarboxylase-like PLP-dependent enzyme